MGGRSAGGQRHEQQEGDLDPQDFAVADDVPAGRETRIFGGSSTATAVFVPMAALGPDKFLLPPGG